METGATELCLLCKNPSNILYAEFIKSQEICVHYLCLLLSPALYQKGYENNDFYGFLGCDIKREERRIYRQKCCYCKKTHANLSCYIKRCNRSFHIDCGLTNGCSYKTIPGKFSVLCHEHRTFEKMVKHESNEVCAICRDEMGDFDYNQSIFADCCKLSWYHRECLVRMADTAGYFFKCPFCNNKEKFERQVGKQGIFVHERDAAWERESNAFADLYERPKKCSVDYCKCKKGREFVEDEDSAWSLIFCHGCGSNAVHEACLSEEYFFCKTCQDIKADALLKSCIDQILDDTLDSIVLNERSRKLFNEMPKCYVKLIKIEIDKKCEEKKIKRNNKVSSKVPCCHKIKQLDEKVIRIPIEDDLNSNFEPPTKRQRLDSNIINNSDAAKLIRAEFNLPPLKSTKKSTHNTSTSKYPEVKTLNNNIFKIPNAPSKTSSTQLNNKQHSPGDSGIENKRNGLNGVPNQNTDVDNKSQLKYLFLTPPKPFQTCKDNKRKSIKVEKDSGFKQLKLDNFFIRID